MLPVRRNRFKDLLQLKLPEACDNNQVRMGAGVCLASGSNLHDLDWTHVAVPFYLSSQERWLFLNQLNLQLFICKVTE